MFLVNMIGQLRVSVIKMIGSFRNNEVWSNKKLYMYLKLQL